MNKKNKFVGSLYCNKTVWTWAEYTADRSGQCQWSILPFGKALEFQITFNCTKKTSLNMSEQELINQMKWAAQNGDIDQVNEILGKVMTCLIWGTNFALTIKILNN